MPQSLQSNAPSSPLLHKGVVDRQLRQMVLVDESITVAVGALICLSPGSKGEAGGSGSTEALVRWIGFPPFAKIFCVNSLFISPFESITMDSFSS
jgi:hypothetical protein